MDIAKKIKDLRFEKGLSQEALCKKAGIKRVSTLSRIENGHTIPHDMTLKCIASVLNVTLEKLKEETK